MGIGENVTEKFIYSFIKSIRYFINGSYSKLLLENMDNPKINKIDTLSYLNDLENLNLNFEDQLLFINENKKIFYYLNI